MRNTFNVSVNSTELNSPMLDSLLPNIDFLSERLTWTDETLKATIRAVLYNRLDDGDKMLVFVKKTRSGRDYGTIFEPDQAVQAFYGSEVKPNTLMIVLTDRNPMREYGSLYDAIGSQFDLVIPSMKRDHEVDLFCAQVFKHNDLCVFVNKEQKASFVLMNNVTMAKWHSMQSLLPRITPWLFDKHPLEKGSLDTEILISLTKNDHEEYIRLIAEAASKMNLREKLVDSIFQTMKKNLKTIKIERAKNDVDNVESELRRIREMYKSAIMRRQEAIIKLLGVTSMVDNTDENGLQEMFMRNKNLHPSSAEEDKLAFYITGYLDNYDPDLYENMRNNEHSMLYCFDEDNFAPQFRSTENRFKILDRLFTEDADVRVRMVSLMILDLDGFIETEARHNFPVQFGTYLPNPHLNHFACFGGNESAIVDLIEQGELEAAIAQCVSCNGSVNLGEMPTMERFERDLFHRYAGRKILELSDGTLVSPAELLEMEERK